MQCFSTRPTLTMPSRIPIVLSSIVHKPLRTLMRTPKAAFPNIRLATVLALMPLARMRTIPATTKPRAQFRKTPTSTSMISVLHRTIRFPPRPTLLTFGMLPSGLTVSYLPYLLLPAPSPRLRPQLLLPSLESPTIVTRHNSYPLLTPCHEV
jgi:hypothetical protein